MRIGEVCALTWEDVDVNNGVICIRKTIQRVYVLDEDKRYTELLIDTPKTKNSVRDIPMTQDLLRILKPLKKIVNDEFFVLTNDSKPTEPRTYRNYYKRLMKRLGIPELKFHGLRHSFATRCIEAGVQPVVLKTWLGHTNIHITLDTYADVFDKLNHSAINVFESYLVS
jgi:integrase